MSAGVDHTVHHAVLELLPYDGIEMVEHVLFARIRSRMASVENEALAALADHERAGNVECRRTPDGQAH